MSDRTRGPAEQRPSGTPDDARLEGLVSGFDAMVWAERTSISRQLPLRIASASGFPR